MMDQQPFGAPLTGGEALVKALIDSKITHVFGIPGTHTVPLYTAMEKYSNLGRIQHITTRHEQGAGYAAEGFARASKDENAIAAVCTIPGCGVTNVLTPMASAFADSIPMIVISAEVPDYWLGKPTRQFSHQVNGMGGDYGGQFRKGECSY